MNADSSPTLNRTIQNIAAHRLRRTRVDLLAPERAHRRQLLRSISGLLSVVLTGVLGFRLIEGWSFGRSLYFTLITITTVGYGDEGISPAGRVFAVILLLSGIGIASYTLALVVQTAVADPFTQRKRMQRQIDKMSGHVVLCSYGRMGKAVAAELQLEGMTFVVLEKNDELFQQARDKGYVVLHGDPCCDAMLIAAGVECADTLVAATSSEGDNILISLSSLALNGELTIVARADDEGSVHKLKLAGADRIVTPHQSGGKEVAHRIAHPGIASFLSRTQTNGGDVALAELVVEAGAKLDGRKLGEYGREEGRALAFVALERGTEPLRIPPGGQESLRAGDRLILAGDPQQVERMRSQAIASSQAA